MQTTYDTGLPPAGELQLQCCDACGAINYPPRELCGHCLADALGWRAVDGGGTVQSLTELHYSLEPLFADCLPWTVASVKLDCGPVAFAHLQAGLEPGARVCLRIAVDRAGNRVLAALDGDGSGEAAARWLRDNEFKEVTP